MRNSQSTPSPLRRVIRAFSTLRRKTVSVLKKKHDNIPL